ncbi:hypothetical protein F4810DRAFT_716141 [Camillea tinctor]|nr:hypothetical protein F4810DRAFT_716141 [Camillea tinctor]
MARCLSFWALIGLVPGLHATYLPQLRDDHASSSQPIVKRDPCNGFGADFEIGKTYTQADCPALQEFDINGDCDYTKNQAYGTECTFFCQKTTEFLYMVEKPLDHTYCRGPRTCMIKQDKPVDTGFQYTGSKEWNWALQNGISGGFDGNTHSIMGGPGEIPIAVDECGYFTYIGVQKSVCGTLTAAVKTIDENNTAHCIGPVTTTSPVCVTDVRKPSDYPNSPLTGQTVFVRIDCGTRMPLSDRQDPSYAPNSGARLDGPTLDAALQSWVRTRCRVDYKFLFNSFDVRGRGYKDALLGGGSDPGSGLRAAISGCGDVTGWGFEYTPNDPDYDWHAWGRTPIGTKSCVGSAVKKVGGEADGCVGAG